MPLHLIMSGVSNLTIRKNPSSTTQKGRYSNYELVGFWKLSGFHQLVFQVDGHTLISSTDIEFYANLKI